MESIFKLIRPVEITPYYFFPYLNIKITFASKKNVLTWISVDESQINQIQTNVLGSSSFGRIELCAIVFFRQSQLKNKNKYSKFDKSKSMIYQGHKEVDQPLSSPLTSQIMKMAVV
jgi:hypothetical protein